MKVNKDTGEVFSNNDTRIERLCKVKARRKELIEKRDEHVAMAKALRGKIGELDMLLLSLVDEPLQGEFEFEEDEDESNS